MSKQIITSPQEFNSNVTVKGLLDLTNSVAVTGNISTLGQILSSGVDISSLFTGGGGGGGGGGNYLPLSGGSINGDLTVTGNLSVQGTTTQIDTTVATTSSVAIDTNSTETALRITQRGSGDALRVEDSSNIDSTPFIIDQNGEVGIGTSTLSAALTIDQTNNDRLALDVKINNIRALAVVGGYTPLNPFPGNPSVYIPRHLVVDGQFQAKAPALLSIGGYNSASHLIESNTTGVWSNSPALEIAQKNTQSPNGSILKVTGGSYSGGVFQNLKTYIEAKNNNSVNIDANISAVGSHTLTLSSNTLDVLKVSQTTQTNGSAPIFEVVGGYHLSYNGAFISVDEPKFVVTNTGVAEGFRTSATGWASHAEGDQTTASGTASHAEGDQTTASGTASHAEGANTIASGTTSHAQGFQTIASGYHTTVGGYYAHAAHDRSWVWKGSLSMTRVSSTRMDQFLVSAAGGSAFFGNVGIGTDNRDRALTVNGNISATNIVYASSIRATSDLEVAGQFTFTNDGETQAVISQGFIGDEIGLSLYTPNSVPIAQHIATYSIDGNYFTYGGGEADNNLVVKSGKIGLGTNSPNEKLTVVGNISATGNASVSSVNIDNTFTIRKSDPDTNALTIESKLDPIEPIYQINFKGLSGNQVVHHSLIQNHFGPSQEHDSILLYKDASRDGNLGDTGHGVRIYPNRIQLGRGFGGPQTVAHTYIDGITFEQKSRLGIGMGEEQLPAEALTVVGNISATGSIYGDLSPYFGPNAVIVKQGDNLAAKYTYATTLTPNGSAKSASNRVSLIILPGTYSLSSELVIGTEFVDLVGLGAQFQSPAVFVTTNTLNVTANDVRVSGISVGTQAFNIGNNKPLQVFENCAGGDNSFSSGGTASGQFMNCTGGASSFAYSGTASGKFTNCRAGDYSFGSDDGVASGTFTNCTGGLYSFGGNGTASGIFTGCTGEDGSFGFNAATSGTFTNCTGGASSFGGGTGTLSGKLISCRLTFGSFQTPSGAGIIRFCLDGDNNIVNAG